jgi:hypothetical protein
MPMDGSTRPFRFFVEMALWFLIVGPMVIALPWFFLFPFFFLFGALPALITGLFLGLRYRSQPIPEPFSRRLLPGAQVGALATGTCYAAVGLFGGIWVGRDIQFKLVFGILGFAMIGALAGAVAFAVMPAWIRHSGLRPRTQADQTQ